MRKSRLFALAAMLVTALLFVSGCAGGAEQGALRSEAGDEPSDDASADVPQVATGSAFTLAILPDGSLWAWGENSSGQLGDGKETGDDWGGGQPTPIRVGADSDWASVAAGNVHSLALKTDGSLWAWGDNLYGQVGNGATEDQTTPVRVGGDNDWKAIWAGGMSSFAAKQDGSLWVWGEGGWGALGISGSDDRLTPTRLDEPGPWRDVACVGHCTFALKEDGSAWVWGDNERLPFDLAPEGRLSRPTRLDVGDSWAGLGATGSTARGAADVYLLKADGSIWSWGTEQFGSERGWKYVGVGDSWAALKDDQSLWSWGDDSAFGDIGEEVMGIPFVRIGSDSDWADVSIGSRFLIGVKTDGTIWGWGHNYDGQTGTDGADWIDMPTRVEFPDGASESAGSGSEQAAGEVVVVPDYAEFDLSGSEWDSLEWGDAISAWQESIEAGFSAVGLTAVVEFRPATELSEVVQDPPAGTKVPAGSLVSITIPLAD